VFVQPSEEKPYPLIMELRHADLLSINEPIAAYALCPEEVTSSSDQKALIKKLEAHGYGLIIVPNVGSPEIRLPAIPLIQHISLQTFDDLIEAMPIGFRRLLTDAYRSYKQNPVLGVKQVCDFIEGLVLKAGQEAARKKWIAMKDAKPGKTAATLDAMTACQQCNQALASLGAMRAFTQMHRNTNAHFPKNTGQAIKKYRNGRHAFIDGLEKIALFREQMKAIGLTGGVATY
jgi:hypothetical protein